MILGWVPHVFIQYPVQNTQYFAKTELRRSVKLNEEGFKLLHGAERRPGSSTANHREAEVKQQQQQCHLNRRGLAHQEQQESGIGSSHVARL